VEGVKEGCPTRVRGAVLFRTAQTMVYLHAAQEEAMGLVTREVRGLYY
jgi:hypothetical protein